MITKLSVIPSSVVHKCNFSQWNEHAFDLQQDSDSERVHYLFMKHPYFHEYKCWNQYMTSSYFYSRLICQMQYYTKLWRNNWVKTIDDCQHFYENHETERKNIESEYWFLICLK